MPTPLWQSYRRIADSHDEVADLSRDADTHGTRIIRIFSKVDGTRIIRIFSKVDGTRIIRIFSKVDGTRIIRILSKVDGTRIIRIFSKGDETRIIRIFSKVDGTRIARIFSKGVVYSAWLRSACSHLRRPHAAPGTASAGVKIPAFKKFDDTGAPSLHL
jgi:hypothetical protein